ncbi:potassium transporter [Tsukamurella asaccharolytica]|uniref:Potassium transporter n=1 Tax=Tsukamurella asaccharolytica TaxID=2592067 RepID=A0A5C5REC1_9ACTN|nr:potassium transporter [Tsukamurella asaccharolytica]TWS20783.1 potassium transporter [Tsukamurella asaccharolytica]
MDLTPRTETFGAGNLSWLGSKHGVDAARTVTISRSALTEATHYPKGYLPSGTPLALVDGKAVPFNAVGTGGTEVLAGFLLTDQQVAKGGGDIVAPLLDHGRVILSKLPAPVTASATTSGQFIFV